MLNVKELRKMYQSLGAKETCCRIVESLQQSAAGEIGHLRLADFSLRSLAEGLIEGGREWVQRLDPNSNESIMESIAAVDTTALANVTGQLLINAVMDGYQNPAFSVSGMFRSVSTRLSGERIPGIGSLGDESEVVKEGMPFPHVGIGEDFIDTPATDKRGLILPITKEAIFFDRTGLLLERARDVGQSLAIRKEKRCIDVMIGAVNPYKWKGTTYNTYQDAQPWINRLSGAEFALKDWSQVEQAELLFSEMLDPNNNEPIVINPSHLIGSPALKHTMNRIVSATEVRYTGNNAPTETLAANPLDTYQRITSAWIYNRLKESLDLTAAQAKATWFLGDPAMAFRYMENWPITVAQAPQNSEAEFNQDIVFRYKASERGVPVVWDPRYMTRVDGYDVA